MRAGRLPAGLRFGHVVGAAALAGIGFTVSLFVTSLAFESAPLIAEAKIGILVASLLAGGLGTVILLALRPSSPVEPAEVDVVEHEGQTPGQR